MVKLFILGFLYINITASFIVYGGDIDTQTEENASVVTVHKTPTRSSPGEVYEFFVTPRAFPQFNNFFQDKRFWTSKDTPLSSKALCVSYPKLDLKYIDNTLLNKHFENILSNKFVRDDVTRLSNQLLKIYGLKNPSGLSKSFNLTNSFSLIYLYDENILREALLSFLTIINTPDPNRTKGYEWKAQTFVRAFSQLCTSLNVREIDTELNLGIRQMLAMSLGLFPLSYKEWFQEQYPALAKWINTCARNKSKKPLAATFTLSLMHALIPKIYTPLSEQIAIKIDTQGMQPGRLTSTQNESSHMAPYLPTILEPTPVKKGFQKTRGALKKFAKLSSFASEGTNTNLGPYFSGKGTFS